MHPYFIIERGIIMDLNRMAILNFFSECDANNFYTAYELIYAINSYDGSLDDICYYCNDDYFFAMAFGTNVLDAVRAVCYGNYKYSDDYVRFDAYGNLESANLYEIMDMYDLYKHEIADKIIELADVCFDYLDLPEEFYLDLPEDFYLD